MCDDVLPKKRFLPSEGLFFTQSVRKNCLRKAFAQFVHSSYRRATFRQASCLVSPAGCFVKYASKMRLRLVHAGVFIMNLRKILKKYLLEGVTRRFCEVPALIACQAFL